MSLTRLPTVFYLIGCYLFPRGVGSLFRKIGPADPVSLGEVSPTVLRIGPYRFFFFSNEGQEPPHVHVQRDRGLASHELTDIEALVSDNEQFLLEAWHEFSGH